MPGKTSPACHKRVVTIADGVGGNVAEIRAGSGSRLLGHPDRFISREEDKLRTVDVVRLDQTTVPGWVSRTGGEDRTRRVVERGNPIDQIAVALPKPRAVRSMLSDNLDIKVLPKIKLPYETFATVAFVSGTRPAYGHPSASEPGGWGFANHGVEADALHTKFAGVKCLAGGKES